jgi:hypothetical protein
MPRRWPADLIAALKRPNAQISTHSTLELVIVTGAETKSYFFATARLSFGGLSWLPELQKTSEISATLGVEADQASVEIQNVNTRWGKEFIKYQASLSGADARVGRFIKDLDRGTEWLVSLLTGLVTGVSVNEMSVQLTMVSDVYANVNVGASRPVRLLCQAPDFKSFECGSTSDLSKCDRTRGACQQRHPGNDADVKHMGFPFFDTKLPISIPQ